MYFGAASRCEFTNAMYAVVRICTENKSAAPLKRESFSDELERPCCIWGKDDGIAPWRLKE